MSGGRFDYVQYRFTQIADEIERAIENNNVPNDEWSSGANDFSDETLAEFRTAIDLLKRAQSCAKILLASYGCGFFVETC